LSLAALERRLAAIEAKLAPPPPPPPAVDEKLLIARLSLWLSGRQCPDHVLSARLAASRERKRKPYTSGLSAYADSCGYRDETELCQIAFGDGEEFYRRHAAANPPSYDIHQVHPSCAKGYRDACDAAKREDAFHVRRAVLATFIEEHVHQILDAMFPYWDTRPGLSPVRPLRPANAEPVDVDDAVLSDIGKSLLALAARRGTQ
jgi:hypothetical protein